MASKPFISVSNSAVRAAERRHPTGRERMVSPTLLTLQDSILLLPWSAFQTRGRRVQAFLNELANGTFGGEGEFVEGRDFAPERHWQPHDLHIRELYDKYAKHPRAARQCLQNKPLFLAGRCAYHGFRYPSVRHQVGPLPSV
jgi:hypothetical protein